MAPTWAVPGLLTMTTVDSQKTYLFKKLTRRERLKSALYLRLKKRKTFFFGKNLEIFEKNFFRKMSDSAEKCKRGTLFDL